MKIVCISDTHNRRMIHPVPDGDLLIHAGDATIAGTLEEIDEFADWWTALPHRNKIFVAGNHDWLYQRNPNLASSFVRNLHDDLMVVDGLRIYGSSWQPEFGNWAFGLPRGNELRRVWSKIPQGVDILVTHTPPRHILDENGQGLAVGCEDLFERVVEVKPRLHVFGHIHESYGICQIGETQFVNASICDATYRPIRKPIDIEL